MDNKVNENKQKELKLILLMKEQKNNNVFIDNFISLYTNEELYGVMRKIQYEIRQRNIKGL